MSDKRSTWNGSSGLLAVPALFIALDSLARLFNLVVHQRIAVSLISNQQMGLTIDGHTYPVNGLITLDLARAQLSGTALGYLVPAHLVFAAGVLAASVWFIRAISDLAKGRRTDRVVSDLARVSTVLLGTFLVSGMLFTIASNVVIRDLGLSRRLVSGPVSATVVFAATAAVGAISVLRHQIQRTVKAEQELDGLV